jgi:hypothetical protein
MQGKSKPYSVESWEMQSRSRVRAKDDVSDGDPQTTHHSARLLADGGLGDQSTFHRLEDSPLVSLGFQVRHNSANTLRRLPLAL